MHRHRRPVLGQGERQRASDSHTRTRHERDLSIQISCCWHEKVMSLESFREPNLTVRTNLGIRLCRGEPLFCNA